MGKAENSPQKEKEDHDSSTITSVLRLSWTTKATSASGSSQGLRPATLSENLRISELDICDNLFGAGGQGEPMKHVCMQWEDSLCKCIP